MKNIKNFLLVLTLVAVVLSFCGCSRNKENETTQNMTTERATTERVTTENVTTGGNKGTIDDTTNTGNKNGIVEDIEEGVTKARNFVDDVVDDASEMFTK